MKMINYVNDLQELIFFLCDLGHFRLISYVLLQSQHAVKRFETVKVSSYWSTCYMNTVFLKSCKI